MKRDLLFDYLSYITLKTIGPIIRLLPVEFSLFLGRTIGTLVYYFDVKHRSLVYANIRKAFVDKFPPQQLCKITKRFYQNFGQNIIEIFLIPSVDKEYMRKHITVVGKHNIDDGFKKGKGVFLLGVHAGSWELSNIISANLAFPFCLFVRHQKYPRLNKLLNFYRKQKGCKIIQRQNQTRDLIEAMRNNEAIGMTADQGGKSGTAVKFLGKDASMSTGAIRIALKYDVTLLPAFYARVEGPNHKVIIEPPFEVKKDLDIRQNLQELIHVFEKNILQYPYEYLWTYKIWKYGKEQDVLILSDGKVGHLRQAQAAANIAKDCFAQRGINVHINIVEVKFKNGAAQSALKFSCLLSGRYNCQGCLWCLKKFLNEETCRALIHMKPDMIISCGSSVAALNFILSRENLAKSIAIMRPSFLSTRRFDLVIMPQHDRPPKKRNIAVTEGALNLINKEYLQEQTARIIKSSASNLYSSALYIGLLIGGDTKKFSLTNNMVLEVIRQVKSTAQNLDADILVTTSRRTSQEIEALIKKEFTDYPRSRLLIIANERNIPEAVGGILGLSQIVITSCESISMVSEAASSKKYTFVFKTPNLGRKHVKFLNHFAGSQYIYLTEAKDLSKKIIEVWSEKPSVCIPEDNQIVRKAIAEVI